jgi:CO/xanthine dehydrogenase FAD-binding subunit
MAAETRPEIRHLRRPTRIDDALSMLAEAASAGQPRPLVMAGGTDLMVVLNGGALARPAAVLDLWGLDELRGLRLAADGALEIGALSTYREIAASPDARRMAPLLVEAARTIGAAQIQARGTLGGNVVNASPAGDTLPVLLAHDGEAVLRSLAGGERRVPFTEFFRGYRKPDVRSDELLVAVRLPALPDGARLSFRKVGTRLAQAISKVVLAMAGRRGSDGRLDFLRLAAGSLAEVPLRLRASEAAALGGEAAAVAVAAGAAAAAEVRPVDDVRSNAEYRRIVTARLVERFVRDLASAP